MKELVNIQSELKAPKSQYNSFGKYKYRSCEDILEAVKPLLKANKCILTITDSVKQVGELIFVEARATIMNEKGHEVWAVAQAGINPNKKGMDIAQSFGASSSYARKYSLNGLFLIDDTKDADTEAPQQKKKFDAKAAQGEKLKGTASKDLRAKYIITDDQIKRYEQLK
jgi:hypothetical protein